MSTYTVFALVNRTIWPAYIRKEYPLRSFQLKWDPSRDVRKTEAESTSRSIEGGLEISISDLVSILQN